MSVRIGIVTGGGDCPGLYAVIRAVAKAADNRGWQGDALTAIASGRDGGPMAALGPLISHFEGAQAKPIKIEMNGMHRSVSIPGVLDIAIEGIAGAKQDEPISFHNIGHPAAQRLALAKASRSHMHAFGIDWDDTSGRNNGHFAPFAWSSS